MHLRSIGFVYRLVPSFVYLPFFFFLVYPRWQRSFSQRERERRSGCINLPFGNSLSLRSILFALAEIRSRLDLNWKFIEGNSALAEIRDIRYRDREKEIEEIVGLYCRLIGKLNCTGGSDNV